MFTRPPSPETAHHRASLARRTQSYPADHAKVLDAMRALEAGKAADRIEAIVADWPELSGQRLDRVAALLRAGRTGEAKRNVNTEWDAHIVALRLAGMTQRKIAAEVGTSARSVERALQRAHMKAMLDKSIAVRKAQREARHARHSTTEAGGT